MSEEDKPKRKERKKTNSGKCCSVWGCSKNSSRDGVGVFSFPKPDKEPARHEEWMRVVNYTRADFRYHPASSFVCADHFDVGDIENLMKIRLLSAYNPNDSTPWKLAPGAVPKIEKLPRPAPGSTQSPSLTSPSPATATSRQAPRHSAAAKKGGRRKETPTTYKKRKVFRMSEEESVFVVEGIGTNIQDGTCKKEVSSQVEDDGMDSLGENLTIKQEIMDSERGEDSLPENKDWNLSETVEVKEEITIKEEQVEVFDFPGCI